jgi:hypothetical protein
MKTVLRRRWEEVVTWLSDLRRKGNCGQKLDLRYFLKSYGPARWRRTFAWPARASVSGVLRLILWSNHAIQTAHATLNSWPDFSFARLIFKSVHSKNAAVSIVIGRK